MEKFGIERRHRGDAWSLYETLYDARTPNQWNPDAAFPVYAYLADDSDVLLRRDVLSVLSCAAAAHGPSALPALRRHLHDEDPLCRAYAARGVWCGARDSTILPAVVQLLGDPDREARSVAATTLCQMAGEVPESFPHLKNLYHDGEFKSGALQAMPRFGKRGIPIIRDALRENELNLLAVVCARHLGKDGVELVPDLLSLRRTYGHPYIDDALYAIDPAQFPRNKN